MRWWESDRCDAPAVALADRHYSRRTPGSPQMMPPGEEIVLVVGDRAVWGTSLQQHVKHAWPGAWVCTIFRNEGAGLSSELVIEAVAATRWKFGTPPAHGMITFVDSARVRRKRDPGRCFLRAGFRAIACTLGGHGRRPLLVLQLLPTDMPAPEAPLGAELELFGGAAS